MQPRRSSTEFITHIHNIEDFQDLSEPAPNNSLDGSCALRLSGYPKTLGSLAGIAATKVAWTIGMSEKVVTIQSRRRQAQGR
jgi:hypothetical protein